MLLVLMKAGQASIVRGGRQFACAHTLSFLGDDSHAPKLHDCKLGTVHGEPACSHSTAVTLQPGGQAHLALALL